MKDVIAPCEGPAPALEMLTTVPECKIEVEYTEENDAFDPDHFEERFRVDRRILEQMLQEPEHEAFSEAAKFFQQVMETTNTVVTWPSKLKIGAKSKKDPHIKISGKPEAVKEAKSKVMSVLDTKSTRVTLKIDVPFTDHSHIIGKGGNNIKRVMIETGCHIHFPDSNRNNPTEKSNQVSIAGQPIGVEKARASIRDFSPLIFTFDMPVTGIFQPIPDVMSAAIQKIQQVYNITVQFRQRPRVYSTTVVVRGNEIDSKQVKEGTRCLMEHLAGTPGVQVPVTMTVEIAPQHHPLVMGRGNCNVNIIMQQTATTIEFPNQTQNAQLRKSTVIITGSTDGVYLARQKLIGCLPLVLMFDMKENQEVDSAFLGQLMERFDVFMSIKPKPKQPSRSVIVKGVERNASKLYETRRFLLNCEFTEVPVPVCVPSSYNLHHQSSMSLGSDFGVWGRGVLAVNTNSYFPNPMPSPHVSPKGCNMLNFKGNYNSSWTQTPGYPPHRTSESLKTLFGSTSADEKSSVCSSTTSTLSSPNPSPRQGSPVDISGIDQAESLCMLPRSPNTLATTSLNRLQTLLERCSYDVVKESMDSKNHSENQASSSDASLEQQFPSDYNEKKALAFRAIKQKPAGPEQRVPTNSWSGYGFSKSMPESVAREKLDSRHNAFKKMGTHLENVTEDIDKDPWKHSGNNGFARRKIELNMSYNGTLEKSVRPIGSKSDTKLADLTELLSKLDLGKYSDIFQQQEIDLATFLTMSDQDLKDLGISTFGARRKMLLAISELNKHTFAAAPGAERAVANQAKCW